MKYTLILVEGFHDAEVVGRILSGEEFIHIKSKKEVDPIWGQLIPTKFPVGDDLLERVNVPLFYNKGESSIAIKICGSITKIGTIYGELRNTILNGFKDIDNVFIIIDCDNNSEIDLRRKMVDTLSFPSIGKGVTSIGGKKYGLFIMPNNNDTGTIEKLLIECGRTKYPDLIDKATSFIDAVDLSLLTPKDKEELIKPFGKEKAVVGVAANILKPGKSITVSIHDNRWIEPDVISSTSVNSLVQYIVPNL